jgi:hypothetical protein
MGKSKGISMQFVLSSLLTPVEGLHELIVPFDKKEMADVIKAMPIDRAPGPDGFYGLFVKNAGPSLNMNFTDLRMIFTVEVLSWRILMALI